MNKERYYKMQSADDVKSLSFEELKDLATTLRHDIIQHTSENGGHIGASLCCVELILGMHKVFTTPKDSFVFDVGHQAYAHKMLTGRRFQFYKLRKENGISGFTNRSESEHDAFGAGHASTSISAALGILEGKKQNKDDGHVVAFIGDGSLTGGLAFEGLNHAGDLKRNLIVIFNDNKISIDPNTGALKDSMNADSEHAKNYFNTLGFDYWGPQDGHDLDVITSTLEKAKAHNKPVVLHFLTNKGLGYSPAVKDRVRFHGCGPFDLESGAAIPSSNPNQKFQDIFADTLIEMASRDKAIVAITAAMPSGTSLKKFKTVHPDRFYDVGIAEGHAAEFGAGLATQGLKPFVCIYSTFLQRAYDQLIHDIALQNLPVRICMDRGGVVGDDGATHQGVFDYAYMRCIPNFVVMSPKDESELQRMMETMRGHNSGPISVRFPRGQALGVALPKDIKPIPIGESEFVYGNLKGDVLILAIGDPVNTAVEAAKVLEATHETSVSVVNLRFVKPLDTKRILELAPHFRAIVTVEEGTVVGGVGSGILELLHEHNILKPVVRVGVPDQFLEHASQDRQREFCGLDVNGITQAALEAIRKGQTQMGYEKITPIRGRTGNSDIAS